MQHYHIKLEAIENYGTIVPTKNLGFPLFKSFNEQIEHTFCLYYSVYFGYGCIVLQYD